MKKVLLFLFFLSYTFFSDAQKDLRSGYIINHKGDTLKGKINFQGDIINSKKCVFYPESNKVEEFKPSDIYGYRFENGKYYISKSIVTNNTVFKIFAEYLVNGRKDLFYYRDYSGPHYLLSLNDSSLVEIPYKEEIIKIEDKSYIRESTRHIGFLKSYFSDCPSIFSKIENMKEPNSKKLISITKEYHDKTCGDNNCIIYRKQKMTLKLAFEPYYGIYKFKGDASYSKQYGGLLYLWLPESNEKLYLKSGVMYSEYSKETSMYKIPLQFEYLFPYKYIRPKFDIGLNIYALGNPSYTEGMALTLATSGGVLLRATKNFYLDLSIETDILQFIYETNFFLSHSYNIGVFILF